MELRRHNVNHVAIENTARVVEAFSTDVLAVVEAEDRIALQRFNDSYLVPRGVGFTYHMLIDGNDERGIDVGLYSKHTCHSQQHRLLTAGRAHLQPRLRGVRNRDARWRHSLGAGEPLKK